MTTSSGMGVWGKENSVESTRTGAVASKALRAIGQERGPEVSRDKYYPYPAF
jgi:hypothetical protein